MLLPDEIFRLALLTVLMGFAGMAALQTLEVWRQRTAIVEGRPARPLTAPERFGLLCAAAGVVAMLASFGFRTAMGRDGFLVGDGLQTVSMPPGYALLELTADEQISADTVLARFRPLRPDDAVHADSVLEVRSTVAGAVAYRSPSPASASRGQPLLVVVPTDGVRARVILPTREVEDLRVAGSVPVDLLGARFDERRFSGHLVAAHAIEGRPAWSVADLAGLPHPDAVREMVAATASPLAASSVKVELRWSPALPMLPLFRTGVALALAGLVAFLVARTGLALVRLQEDPA